MNVIFYLKITKVLTGDGHLLLCDPEKQVKKMDEQMNDWNNQILSLKFENFNKISTVATFLNEVLFPINFIRQQIFLPVLNQIMHL